MPELNGWGPLVALWIAGAVHLMLIVRRDGKRWRGVVPRRKAA